jgi:hypothetical protein
MSQSIYTSHYTYIIKNKTNQMQYIGVRSCNCLPENDSGYMGSSKILGEAMKVEPEPFTKIIIDTFPAREIANSNEQWLHETYDVARNPLFYNQMNAPLGFDHTGKHHSKETKEKMSVSKNGKTLSPETRKKISEAKKGKAFSPEHKKNISAAQSGENHHMYGKHFSAEHKKKISAAMSGKKNHWYGKKRSPETINKMRVAMKGKNKGKTLSPAHKKKLRGPRGPQKKLPCPHCSKIGGGNAMKRWHFAKCREIS